MGRPKNSKNKEKLSQEQINELIKLYIDERVPIYKLEKMFKTKKIKDYITNSGNQLRNFRDAKRLYPFNEHYFDTIDTKDKAYFLGFLYADGCVRKGTNGQFHFKLSLKDEEPIVLFRKYLQSNKPIGVYKNSSKSYSQSTLYQIDYSSKITYDALVKWGCVENKTFLLKFPTFLHESLIPHFIRGYFDGDGTVFICNSINKKRNELNNLPPNKQIYCGFSGTFDFLYGLLQALKVDWKVLYKDKRKSTDCWQIRISSNCRSKIIYDYLYKDCDDLFLKRKKDIFDNFFKEKGSETIIANPKIKD